MFKIVWKKWLTLKKYEKVGFIPALLQKAQIKTNYIKNKSICNEIVQRNFLNQDGAPCCGQKKFIYTSFKIRWFVFIHIMRNYAIMMASGLYFEWKTIFCTSHELENHLFPSSENVISGILRICLFSMISRVVYLEKEREKSFSPLDRDDPRLRIYLLFRMRKSECLHSFFILFCRLMKRKIG